jgi:RNA polymerase sigma-70 factor (ECF subfamily)
MARIDERRAPVSHDTLLQRVASAQDRAAFQSLFLHFAPRIKAFLTRGGLARQTAEDLAQETMLTVWRKAHLFDRTKASPATWIFTIARNLRIDQIRRERRPLFDPADPSIAPEMPAQADDELSVRESTENLRHVLETLPPEQAQIISLSFFSDKPHSQIATELDIPLGTVKSRIRLAIARLKGEMEDGS